MIVIKRNGNAVTFDKDKIVSAIRKSMVECNVDVRQSEMVADKVINRLDEEYVYIEDIQDEVESCLMELGFKDVAKAYILYRNERTRKRNQHPLDKSILGLIDMTNIEVITENSNKQSQLASTQRDLIAGEVSKYISREKFIPKDIVDEHDRGIIHLHDSDYFLQPLTNCELVPLDDMFENGTVINKKLIRKPKS
ncbi:MAG: anaerobic ribonucleoside-triphosphate reductase, partial [Sarcina sp.]